MAKKRRDGKRGRGFDGIEGGWDVSIVGSAGPQAGSHGEPSRGRFALAMPIRPLRWTAEPGPAPRRCQWLDGEPPFLDTDKCGRPTVDKTSYCAAHLARSRVAEETAERFVEGAVAGSAGGGAPTP